MSFKKNLKAKIQLDSLLKRLLLSIREPPEKRWLDKDLTRELLDMTDFKHSQIRDIHLYLRPLEGEVMEAVVFDNELAIYHTTVDDIALRRSPRWQEIFSISNIRKIMNDRDVVLSKGSESLKRLHAHALTLLDLTYSSGDVALMLEDARLGFEQDSIGQVRDSLDLFIALVDFQAMSFEWLEKGLHIFTDRKIYRENVSNFDPIILFDEKTLFLGMKKWTFSQHGDTDINWFMKYNMKKEMLEVKGMDVFKFLAELAFKNIQGAEKSIGMN